MPDITKDDLLYDDYNWKAKQQGDDPKKRNRMASALAVMKAMKCSIS